MTIHDAVRLIMALIPMAGLILTLNWVRNIRPPDMSKFMHDSERIRAEATQRMAEQKAYQDTLLAELKRQNELAEQQTGLLARLLEAVEKPNAHRANVSKEEATDV